MRQRRAGSPFIVRPRGKVGRARKHPLYGSWAGMISRCHNPNHSSFAGYGGRGVIVCDRWRFGDNGQTGFQCFLADMGERPEGKTLDRYPNPAGPYAPDNCRWATNHEQRSNITPEGDRRMRRAMSAGVKARWREWRTENEVRRELAPSQQKVLIEVSKGHLPWPRRDGMEARTFRALIRYGFAREHEGCGCLIITDAGTKWLLGGKPENRKFAPDHLREEADVLDFTKLREVK